MRASTASVWLGLVLVLPAARAQDAPEAPERVPVRLAHRFSAGSALAFTGTIRLEAKQQGATLFGSTTTSDSTIRCLEVDPEGKGRFEQSFGELVHEVRMQGQRSALDTRRGERSGNPGVDMAANMVGGRLLATVAPDGTVVTGGGGAELLERLVKDLPPGAAEQVRQQQAPRYTDQGVAQQLQETWLRFPAEELQPDGAWTTSRKIDVQPLGAVEAKITWTYQGIVEKDGRRLARLRGSYASEPIEGRDVVIQGQRMKLSLSSFEGSIPALVDVADGSIHTYGPGSLEYGMTMLVGGQKVEQRITIETTLRRR